VFYLFDAGQCDAVLRGARPLVPGAAAAAAAAGTGDLLPPAAADRLVVVDRLTPLAVFSSTFRRSPREEVEPETVASPKATESAPLRWTRIVRFRSTQMW